MNRWSVGCAAWGLIALASVAMADDTELKRLQGHWQVIELVEDGKVIPPSAIEDWLPSGGKIEIVDNAIVTTSTDDGKKHVRILQVDPTQYPKGIEIKSRDKSEVLGIYRFDNDRLLVCVADSEEATRPREFSAKAGSKRMLLTGSTWKYNDANGALVLTLNSDGGFSTTRESTEMRLFK